MNETGRVVLACALGATLCGIVFLDLGWPLVLGITLGGAASYLSYLFSDVLRATPRAWRAARGWRPNRAYWGGAPTAALDAVPMTTAYLGAALVAFSWLPFMKPRPDNSISILPASAFVSVVLFMGIYGFAVHFFMFLSHDPAKRHSHEHARTLALCWNPVSIPFFHLPRWIAKGAFWTVIRIPYAIPYAILESALGFVRLIRFAGRFAWHLFRLINSEPRLTCLAGGASGGFIGCFMGHVLACTVAGALTGLVSRELISKRWLKLIPRESRT